VVGERGPPEWGAVKLPLRMGARRKLHKKECNTCTAGNILVANKIIGNSEWQTTSLLQHGNSKHEIVCTMHEPILGAADCKIPYSMSIS